MTFLSKMLATMAAPLAIALIGVPSVAWAQESTPDNPNAQEARALMQKGLSAASEEEFEKARIHFRKSLELYESYDVACNLGLVEFQLQRYLDAARSLELCLRMFPTGENRELLKTAKAQWKEAQKYVGSVQISVSRPGATISIDGEGVGTSPLDRRVFLMAGEHTVSASLEETATESVVSVKKGEETRVELVLERGEQEQAVTGSDVPKAHDDEPAPRAKKNWVPAYILGGVTVAALGTSMVFRGLASGKANENERLLADLPSGGCPMGSSLEGCDEIDRNIKQHDGYADAANVSMIVTGVAAAALITYVTYTLLKREKPDRVGVAVGTGHTGSMLFLNGKF